MKILAEELLICEKCEIMLLSSNCKMDINIKLTGQIGTDKVLFHVDQQILSQDLGHAWCKTRHFI